jgi:hypothetical protein
LVYCVKKNLATLVPIYFDSFLTSVFGIERLEEVRVGGFEAVERLLELRLGRRPVRVVLQQHQVASTCVTGGQGE